MPKLMPEESLSDKLAKIRTWVGARSLEWTSGIRMLQLILITRRSGFLMGGPGTAKSQAIIDLLKCLGGYKRFSLQLTPETTRKDLVGYMSIPKFVKDGVVEYETQDSLVDSDVAHLGELPLGNSATLNGLLSVINEGHIRLGSQTFQTRTVVLGDGNEMPDLVNLTEGDVKRKTLAALFDRLLFRERIRPFVRAEENQRTMLALPVDRTRAVDAPPVSISRDEMDHLTGQVTRMAPINSGSWAEKTIKKFLKLISTLRKNQINISDRRMMWAREALVANAILDGRDLVQDVDFKTVRWWGWLNPSQNRLVLEVLQDLIETGLASCTAEEVAVDKIYQEAVNPDRTWNSPEEKIQEGNKVAAKISDSIRKLLALATRYPDECDEIVAVVSKLRGYNHEVNQRLVGITLDED